MYERFISSSMLTGWCCGTRSAMLLGIWDSGFGIRSDSGSVTRVIRESRIPNHDPSDVQVLYIQRVVLDELAARLHLIAHQRREHQVRFGVILGAHLQQRARFRIHRRRPELIGIHFAEALVAVDRDTFLSCDDEEIDDRVERLQADVAELLFAVGAGDRGHDDVAVDGGQVAMIRQQRPVLGSGDEIDADRMLPRVPARSIFDVQQIAVVLFVALHGDRPRRRRQRLRERLELVLVGEVLAVGAGRHERFDDLSRMAAPLDDVQELLVRDHLLQQPLQIRARDFDLLRRDAHDARFGGALDQVAVELALVLDVGLGLAAFHAKQRRLRDIHVAALDERRQLAVEERQEQRADVRAVDVRVRHDDDAMVPDLVGIEIFDADAASERSNHRLDLVAAEHLVEARLLDVQNLALERQNRLEPPIAPLFRRPAGRLALDDVQLAESGIALLTIGELARQRAAVEGAFAPDEIARLAGGLARACGIGGLADASQRNRRVYFEKGAELVVDDRFDDALHLGVAQLRLRLPFELRMRNLAADHGDETFADV